MPLLKSKPKFNPDEAVVPVEPFSGSIDGTPFVCNPSETYRGDDEVVLRYPRQFVRFDDDAGRRAYWDRVFAERDAELRRQKAEEQKAAEKRRKAVQRLADQLEPQARRLRAQGASEQANAARRLAEERQQQQVANEQAAEEAHIRRLAEIEVERRLATESEAEAA